MRMQRKHLIVAALVGALTLAVGIALRPMPLTVELARVERGPLQVTIDEDGLTRVKHHAELTAPVSGRLAEGRVRVGDSVTAGMIVATMSPAPLDPRTRAQAEASLQAAVSLRQEAEARVEQARVALTEATRARARTAQLEKVGGASQRELEQAVDADRLRSRDLAAANARLHAAQQEERRAQLSLVSSNPSAEGRASRVLLRAPIAGRVLRLFEEHDRVVAAGTSLIEIGDPASLEVVVDVLTRDAAEIRVGAPMLIHIGGGKAVRGCVSRLEPAAFTKVSPLGVEEQRVNVIGELLEPVTAGDRFEVEASIEVWESPDVTRLPTSALVPVGSGWGTFVVSAGRASLRQVEIGRRGTLAAEVRAGVAAGDSVVIHPDDRLRDGSRVAVNRK